jgi:hypothetical protein
LPLIGILCPDKSKVSFDHCLDGCQNRCTPYPIAYSIIKAESENFHKGNVITATSIIGCIRNTYLTRTIEYYDRFANLWYSFRGGAIHSSLEVLKGDIRWLIEKRFEGKIAGIPISGQIDAYDRVNSHLYDYKSSMDKNVEYIKNNGAKKEHSLQVSIYRQLMRQDGIEIMGASVVYLSMQEIYPCTDIIIYGDDTVNKYVDKYGGILYNAFNNGKCPPAPDPKPTYLCVGYCPVYDICEKI